MIKESVWPKRNRNGKVLSQKSANEGGGAFDPELRSVLELATESELYEIETILFGPRLLITSVVVAVFIHHDLFSTSIQTQTPFFLFFFLMIITISYWSPLLKSLTLTTTTTLEDLDRSMIGHDLQLRQQFLAALESRFFFLAADARSTLRFFFLSFFFLLLLLSPFVTCIINSSLFLLLLLFLHTQFSFAGAGGHLIEMSYFT